MSRTALGRIIAIGAALVALVALACAATARAATPFALPTKPMSAADAAALPVPPAVGPAVLGQNAAPGYLYGVWDPQRGVLRSGTGLANVAAGTAPTADDSFRIGSITKTFVATAVLLLVDDGKVQLDAPVSRYVGTLTSELPQGRTATVRQLLGMRSGFPDYTNSPTGPFGDVARRPHHVWTPREIIAGARDKPTKLGQVRYSSTNYVVLGELVRRVSGQTLSAFVRTRILRPLSLTHTTIPSPGTTALVTTHGYLNAGWAEFDPPAPPSLQRLVTPGQDVTTWSSSIGGAAGNGVSTLDDLARWGASDFGNSLLSPRTRKARNTFRRADAIFPNSTYGLGLEEIDGWHYHGGEIFGWETILMANPQQRKVVVVNANACCGNSPNVYGQAADTFPTDLPKFKRVVDFLR